jgi:hypothetical protein
MPVAQRNIENRVCDRCDFSRAAEATTHRNFTIDETHYRLELCDKHAAMFDRDLGTWTLLAAEVEPTRARSQFFGEEERRRTARIRELKERANSEAASQAFAERRAKEIDSETLQRAEFNARQLIPGALKWRLTDHARERMVERGFAIEEVLRAAATPGVVIRQPWRGPAIAVHSLGDCRVAVNESTYAIITVIDRTSPLESDPRERAAQ